MRAQHKSSNHKYKSGSLLRTHTTLFADDWEKIKLNKHRRTEVRKANFLAEGEVRKQVF